MPADADYKFIKDRLNLFDDILRKGFDCNTGKLWLIEPAYMRFRLGESVKDLKIPYLFGVEDEPVIEKSILSLILLLKRRFEPNSEQEVKDSFSSLLDIKTILIDKTYRADYFLPDSAEKGIACEILTTTPMLDSGILKTWLGADGYGKRYYTLVRGILRKAVLEEMRLEGVEKTSILAIMAMVNATAKRKDSIIRSAKVKGFNYERLDQVIGLALYFVYKAAVKNVASELKQIAASYSSAKLESFEEWFTPMSFLTIQGGNIINSDLNPYGLGDNVVSLLRPVYDKTAAKAKDVAGIIAAMENEVKKDSPLTEELLKLSNINYLRQLISDYLLDYDTPGIGVNAMLAELYADNRLIQMLSTDSKVMTRLKQGLDDVKIQFQNDTARLERINVIEEFVASITKTSFRNLFRIGRKKGAAITDIIEAFVAYKFDEDVERFVSSMRGLMVDRRGEFSSETLRMEYERGRLYLFSADERPILRELEVEAEGHLFVDMKDFTRKTLRAKEITMADFMESNFYKPILNVASRYGSSTPDITSDKRNIKLNNLLGDAAVFSGGVSNLIALAGDIRLIMKRYKEQLEKRVPHVLEEELLHTIHKNFEAMKEELAREQASIEKAISSGEKGLEAKMLEVKEKEYRLEKTYREELEAAIGQEMEAGLFITFGSKAEIIVMKDGFWGEVKVAIAEKINEAARGTDRSSMVRAKRERLLEEERLKRNNHNLKYPLDIYIDKTYGLLMPPSLDDKLENVIVHKNVSEAKDLAQVLAQECFKDFRRIVSGEPLSSLRILNITGDIYNKGQALSEDALKEYIRETKGKGLFFKREVPVSELDKEIQSAFFFHVKLLELWFGVFVIEGIKHVEIFCKAGEIIFKGFESTTPKTVYEMVNKDSEFSKLLFKHHFDNWYEEAKTGAERKRES
ncbi:MAG: hypothetical protein HZB54_03445 [Deltaproteobacteria bacterium]|nr:hypothetical protein [Deltaproteobacteria bacterium]